MVDVMLFEQRLWAGLAESLEVGYRLSPRGRALLGRLGEPRARE
jgi:hypothetical protein